MDDIAASVIAVLGTLLGVGLTYVFQERGSARTERQRRGERLRQERLDAYCGYAGALVNYRRSLMDRWFCVEESRPDEEEKRARHLSYELRSVAQEALFRVRMLTADPDLSRDAEKAFDEIEDMHHARNRAAFDRRRDVTRVAIDAFVVAARHAVTPR